MVWTCRASLFVTRMLSFAAALLVVLVGFALYADGERVLWLVGAFLLALWAGFRGGPHLVRLLERAGLFGRVRLLDERLEVGRRGRTLDLTRPFECEARFQQVSIRRDVDLRHATSSARRRVAGKGRTFRLDVKVLTARIEQDGRVLLLVADETDRRPGPPYDLEGLAVRRVTISPPDAPVVRLWGADLAEVLRRLQAAPAHAAATSPVPEKGPEDPRRALCPTWKVAVGGTALIAVFVVGALGLLDLFGERHAAQREREEATARALAQERETRARALVGRTVWVDARRGIRLRGSVVDVEMAKQTVYEPEMHDEWRPRLTVEVQALHGPDGAEMPADAEIGFRTDADLVQRGRRVEVGLDEVTPGE